MDKKLELKGNLHPYLANKAVGCCVRGGAAIRTFKATFSPSAFALRLYSQKKEGDSIKEAYLITIKNSFVGCDVSFSMSAKSAVTEKIN